MSRGCQGVPKHCHGSPLLPPVSGQLRMFNEVSGTGHKQGMAHLQHQVVGKVAKEPLLLSQLQQLQHHAQGFKLDRLTRLGAEQGRLVVGKQKPNLIWMGQSPGQSAIPDGGCERQNLLLRLQFWEAVGQFLLDFQIEGGDQLLLVSEMVKQGASCHTGRLGDFGGGGSFQDLLYKQH